MTKEAISTSAAPQPAGSYSQGVVAGGFFFSAGFGPQDPRTGRVADTVAAQTEQVLRNIEAVLKEKGLTLDDVVKVVAYLEHLKRDFAEYNEVYSQFFTEPFPVRTTVGADLNNILVEIDVVAQMR